MRLLDLTNKRFGRFTVLRRLGTNGKNPVWLCRCDCGVEKPVSPQTLKGGAALGCGCGVRKVKRLRPFEALYRRMQRDNTVRLRHLPFTLSYDEFLEFTAIKTCHYCPTEIMWKEFVTNGHGYNLDRKDNSKGYTKHNLAVCCKRCNMGKRDTFTFDEWYGMTSYLRGDIMNTTDQELIESLRETIKAQKQTIEALQSQVSELKMRNTTWLGGGTTFIPNSVPYMPSYTPSYPTVTCGTGVAPLAGASGVVPLTTGVAFQQGRDIRVANAQG